MKPNEYKERVGHVMYKDIDLNKGKTYKSSNPYLISEKAKAYDNEIDNMKELRKELESLNDIKDSNQKCAFNEEVNTKITFEDLLKKEKVMKLLESKNVIPDKNKVNARYYERIEDKIRRKNLQAENDTQGVKSKTNTTGSNTHRAYAFSPIPSKNMMNDNVKGKELLIKDNTLLHNEMKLGNFAMRFQGNVNNRSKRVSPGRLTTEERNAILHSNSYSRIKAIKAQYTESYW